MDLFRCSDKTKMCVIASRPWDGDMYRTAPSHIREHEVPRVDMKEVNALATIPRISGSEVLFGDHGGIWRPDVQGGAIVEA